MLEYISRLTAIPVAFAPSNRAILKLELNMVFFKRGIFSYVM